MKKMFVFTYLGENPNFIPKMTINYCHCLIATLGNVTISTVEIVEPTGTKQYIITNDNFNKEKVESILLDEANQMFFNLSNANQAYRNFVGFKFDLVMFSINAPVKNTFGDLDKYSKFLPYSFPCQVSNIVDSLDDHDQENITLFLKNALEILKNAQVVYEMENQFYYNFDSDEFCATNQLKTQESNLANNLNNLASWFIKQSFKWFQDVRLNPDLKIDHEWEKYRLHIQTRVAKLILYKKDFFDDYIFDCQNEKNNFSKINQVDSLRNVLGIESCHQKLIQSFDIKFGTYSFRVGDTNAPNEEIIPTFIYPGARSTFHFKPKPQNLKIRVSHFDFEDDNCCIKTAQWSKKFTMFNINDLDRIDIITPFGGLVEFIWNSKKTISVQVVHAISTPIFKSTINNFASLSNKFQINSNCPFIILDSPSVQLILPTHVLNMNPNSWHSRSNRQSINNSISSLSEFDRYSKDNTIATDLTQNLQNLSFSLNTQYSAIFNLFFKDSLNNSNKLKLVYEFENELQNFFFKTSKFFLQFKTGISFQTFCESIHQYGSIDTIQSMLINLDLIKDGFVPYQDESGKFNSNLEAWSILLIIMTQQVIFKQDSTKLLEKCLDEAKTIKWYDDVQLLANVKYNSFNNEKLKDHVEKNRQNVTRLTKWSNLNKFQKAAAYIKMFSTNGVLKSDEIVSIITNPKETTKNTKMSLYLNWLALTNIRTAMEFGLIETIKWPPEMVKQSAPLPHRI